MSSEPERQRLPFEPRQSRKKQEKKPIEAAQTDGKQTKNPPSAKKAEKSKTNSPSKPSNTPSGRAVPEVVSRRMISRIAVFSGLPTFLGISTFIASYFVITNHWLDLPNSAVVLVSMAFFGLGVLGLSYGVISASWDEEIPGSALGWKEFTTNFERLTAAWRTAGKKDSET